MYDFFQTQSLPQNEKDCSIQGFYESYFEVFNLIKQRDKFKTHFNHNFYNTDNHFFGAFSNVDHVEKNEEIKCGIPHYIEKTSNKDLERLKMAQTLYKNKCKADIIVVDDSNKEEITSNDKQSSLENKENFEKMWLDISLNFDDVYYKTAENKQTILEKILDNYPNKKKYSSFVEESLLFTPFTVLNYDIALQKNVNNIVYSLRDCISDNKLWKYLFSLIQGIPSDLFVFDEKTFSFIQVDKEVRILGCLPKITENFLNFFINFGSKLRIIQSIVQFFLYTSESCPMILRNFFYLIDELIILIIQTIIKIKQLNKRQVVYLYQEIQSCYKTLSFIYSILDLENAVKLFIEDNLNFKYNSQTFIKFFSENYLKSHNIANTLVKYYESTKNNMYYYTRTLLIYVLKAYLFYVYELIFNSENNDVSHEFFIEKTNEKWYFQPIIEKCPHFLRKYMKILLNITIYSFLIKNYNSEYFSVINIHGNDLKTFIMNIEENIFYSDYIKNFKLMKKEIFNKKIVFLYTLNEKIKDKLLISENNERLKKIEKLRTQKKYREIVRKMENEELINKIENQKKLFIERDQELKEKQRLKEMEIHRIKEEILHNRKQEENRKKIEEEIIERMRNKYQRYLMGNFDSEDKITWKNKRILNNSQRIKTFQIIFDYSNANFLYYFNDFPKNFEENFHYKKQEDVKMLLETEELVNLPDKENMIIEEFNEIIPKKDEEMTNYFYLLIGDIINTCVEKAESKLKNKKEKIPLFKDSDIIDNEILETISQIKMIMDEKKVLKNEESSLEDLPINLIIKEFFYDAIIKQYKIVNKCLIDMLNYKYEIKSYYDILHQYFLCANGDILSEFIDTIVNFNSI